MISNTYVTGNYTSTCNYLFEEDYIVGLDLMFLEDVGVAGDTEWQIINTGSSRLVCLGSGRLQILVGKIK